MGQSRSRRRRDSELVRIKSLRPAFSGPGAAGDSTASESESRRPGSESLSRAAEDEARRQWSGSGARQWCPQLPVAGGRPQARGVSCRRLKLLANDSDCADARSLTSESATRR